MTIDHAKIIADWRYHGFEKQLYMQPYFEAYEQKGKLIGPGGCIGFAALHQGNIAGLFEYYNKSTPMNIGLALNPEAGRKRIGMHICTSRY
ncbi:MAG: hypothetical protein R2852_06910 [Bacteroidia bacterium]